MHKKIAVILITFSLCIIGYIITKRAENNIMVKKEIVYHNGVAAEVYMVWGINSMQRPARRFISSDSYIKDGVVYTKMNRKDGAFHITMALPNNTILNYWMRQTKDIQGNPTDIWDSGGNDKEYTSEIFATFKTFKAGYFVFLAGLLPLLLWMYFNRHNQFYSHPPLYKISSHIPQFDSIRAIAVILVIIHHWFETNKVLNFLPNGALGVNMFFVLSGFLITGILLKAKEDVEADSAVKGKVIRNFYIRRTLRIFPIYYLLLIALSIIRDPEIAKQGIYYFTYTSNYLFFSKQYFPARVAHLWSLAVEEQFYLIWPWIIILINRQWLPYIMAFFLIIGISSNYIFISNGWWVQIFTPACFDAFAVGGFLSFAVACRQDVIEKIQPWFGYIFSTIAGIFLLQVFDYSFLPARTIHSLMAVCVIYYCLFKNNNRVLNFLLNSKWLIRLGKVSYGVYLYHLFIPELWMWIVTKFQNYGIDLLWNNRVPLSLKTLWLSIQEFSLLLILCMISWTFIEKPINNLKHFFEYKKSPMQKNL